MFKGKNIFLRPPEKTDLISLLNWENNEENWKYSDIEAPYSTFQMEKYLENAHDIRNNHQLRLMICSDANQKQLGAIDLYDINFKHKRAGVGILIAEKESRRKGYATEALQLLEKYCVQRLDLFQLFCEIHADNKNSISLFEKNGFIRNGIKKNWIFSSSSPTDVYFYQKFFAK